MPHSLKLAWEATALGALAITLANSAGCAPSEPIVIAKTFSAYNCQDGTFACEYPDGWKAEGGGGRAQVWAKFISGDARIQINASAAGSLMSDAMGGRSADMNAPTIEDAPVHKIHLNNVEMTAQDFGDYQELPGSPAEIKSKLGPARVSEFTGTSYGPMHGYRVTVIGHEKGVRVVCVCPEPDWASVKPMFDHTLASLKRGVVE